MRKKHVVMHHSRTDDQRAIHKKIIKDGVCPFCWKYFTKYHKNPILKKGKYWIVTENAWPYQGTSHHFLFVHKRHIEHLSKIKPDEWQELLLLIKKTTFPSVKNGGSFFIRFGDGDITGASVTHLHAHVIQGGKRKTKKTDPLMVQLGYKI